MTNKIGREKPNTVSASPTKRFFVDMLTRDIELEDAILDLLDNCVDGILRSEKEKLKADNPYSGFWAKIFFNEKKFQIADNCGGIPLKLAENYAFMLGRPKDEGDSDIPTVGMYGIGMKRAIFKMGRSSRVVSQTNTEAFEVTISPKWLSDDHDWDLPLKFVGQPMSANGTVIDVENLREGISNIFSRDGTSSFQNNLTTMIGHHYRFIINKGFKVYVNNEEVKAKPLKLLWSDDSGPPTQRITPFLYKSDINGVAIRLAIGFYTPMISPDELDEEEISRRSKDDAGWTIICNDRVVVYNDKTRLTGWGEAGVPSYHSQFIGISGVVYFQCNDAWKLPVTTTKRGVDTSSELYLYIKEFMREGLKKFTSYTNTWKPDPVNERKISRNAASVSIDHILSIKPDSRWTNVRNKKNELKLNIPLAVPIDANPKRQIRFSRHLGEIEMVSEYLFEDTTVSPAEVGEKCFEFVLKKAQK